MLKGVLQVDLMECRGGRGEEVAFVISCHMWGITPSYRDADPESTCS